MSCLCSRPIASLLLLILCLPVYAEDSEPSPFEIRPDLRLIGAEAELAYKGWRLIPGMDSELVFSLGGDYRDAYFLRNEDGSLRRGMDFISKEDLAQKTQHKQFNLLGYLGFRQEIWHDLWLELYYHAWYSQNFLDQAHQNNVFAAYGTPERDEILSNSFLFTVRYDRLNREQNSGVWRGLLLRSTIELAPLGLNPLGKSSYLRTSVESSYFHALYEDFDPDSRMNRFSLYLGSYNIADYSLGLSPELMFDGVPTRVRQSFGGLHYRAGLGGSVRAYQDGMFDAAFKNASSIELRANLPSVFVPGLIPLALVFFDFGIWGMPIDAGPDEGSWGSLASSGVGLGIDLFGAGSLLLYTQVALKDTPLGNKAWTPIALGFGMHF